MASKKHCQKAFAINALEQRVVLTPGIHEQIWTFCPNIGLFRKRTSEKFIQPLDIKESFALRKRSKNGPSAIILVFTQFIHAHCCY